MRWGDVTMGETARLSELLCTLARSLFDRGLTAGASGNLSVRTSDGGLIVSPSGFSLGRLDPSCLSIFDNTGTQVAGQAPTKEMPLHTAFYETRKSAGAVVHLHSCYSVALSMLPGVDEDCFLPPATPYSIMRLGRVKLLPFYLPGDPAIGDAIRGLAGKRTAVMLANHGPVVTATDLEAACFAIEELEETARLTILTLGMKPKVLTDEQSNSIARRFGVEWN